MSLSIPHPTPEALKKWGLFAYCTDAERVKIFNSPPGTIKTEEKRLERELAYYRKKNKKR